MSTEEQAVTMDEMLDKSLSGEITQEEFDKYLDDSDTEDSRTSEPDTPDQEQEEETVETETEPKANDKPADGEEKADTEEEPILLAKDGKHTIPYSKLEETRARLQESTAEIDRLKQQLLEKTANPDVTAGMQEAQDADEEAGNTDATDAFLAELAEDYPEAGKFLKDLQGELQTLKAEREKQQSLTAAEQANVDFGNQVSGLLEEAGTDVAYHDVVQDKKFWDWFDNQPSYIKAAEQSGDPQQVADVVKLYVDTNTPATGGDTPGKESVSDKVAAAREKASQKKQVASISEIPGGSPYSTEAEAFANMSEEALSDKLQDMDPDDIARYLDKHL